MEKRMMSGNEAIARGVYEAGCHVAAAYPGTPSTEILENIGAFYKDDIYCQWACNEKVAFEIASGASIGGARAFCAFKHVGMNVATDPIFTMGYAGVNGGLVFVSADDPGCHSSQNEQDNRLYAQHAKIAMMEPSDAQECREFAIAAFDLSERYDVPVMLRMTTRVCHSKSIVTINEKANTPVKKYERNIGKFAMLPGTARARHAIREKLLLEMEEYANDCPFNRVEMADNREVGIITSGISYQHAKEVFGSSASFLKLGLTYPLPRTLISEFASQFRTLYVIEETEPYLEAVVRSLGFTNVIGKALFPILGELNTQIIRNAVFGKTEQATTAVDLPIPPRPPVLCAGCPHRGYYYAQGTRIKNLVPVSDIGCYALSINPPLNGFDYSICMGSGFSSLIGLSKALEMQGDTRKAVGTLGDSTFFHSGINSLIDIVTSEANVIAVVLDNSITAMTGHQDNPGTMVNLMGQPSPSIHIEDMVLATGLAEERIRIVDPLDIAAVQSALDDGIAVKGPFVIITKRPCVLIKSVAKANVGKYCRIDAEKCKSCKSCMKIACPAISFSNNKASISDPFACTGCGLCITMCKFDAIEKVGE